MNIKHALWVKSSVLRRICSRCRGDIFVQTMQFAVVHSSLVVEGFSIFSLRRKWKFSWRLTATDAHRRRRPTGDSATSRPRWRRVDQRSAAAPWRCGGQFSGARRASRRHWRSVCRRTAGVRVMLDRTDRDDRTLRRAEGRRRGRRSISDYGQQCQQHVPTLVSLVFSP